MLKKYLHNLYVNAEAQNTLNVLEAISNTGPHNTILDVGCWDGITTIEWKKAAKAKKVLGIEVVETAAKKARDKGIETHALKADHDKWPYKDSSIDCIVSNQVIEHLTNLDHYFSEATRVLKPKGFIITSTNNLSSLHNIFSLFFGWTPFDLTNSSFKRFGLGNPLAIHNKDELERGSSWTHKCIYTAKWLKEWQEVYDLTYVDHLGAGFYPFSAKIGKYIKIYSAFITIVMQKK